MGILSLIVDTASILIGAYIIPGVYVEGMLVAFIVAVVLGVLNLFIKPIIVLLTLPINILTLGLFSLVINTLLIVFADYLIQGFSIDGFWTAFLFAIVISFLNSFLGILVKKK